MRAAFSRGKGVRGFSEGVDGYYPIFGRVYSAGEVWRAGTKRDAKLLLGGDSQEGDHVPSLNYGERVNYHGGLSVRKKKHNYLHYLNLLFVFPV